MSNARPFRRRLSAPQGFVADVLAPLDGARIPGGCDCNAYQTVSASAAGVWTITVHHDDNCRRLRPPAEASG